VEEFYTLIRIEFQVPSLDLFSLVLGFLLGIISLFLVYRIRGLLPKREPSGMRKNRKTNREVQYELLLRKFLLRKVQGLHIASNICPLSDIYIPQKLISSPLHAHCTDDLEEEPVFFRNHLSLTDVPELSTGYPLPQLTLRQALSGGQNIAIMGKIGSGKTTALANLVIEILESRCGQSEFNSYLPIYIHAGDINILGDPADFLGKLAGSINHQYPALKIPDILNILQKYHSQSRLLVLFDGLDELRPQNFDAAVRMLQIIRNEYPNIRMVTTCGPYYTGDLYRAGFTALPIRPPDHADYLQLLLHWRQVWNELLTRELETSEINESSMITELWLKQEAPLPSFFEMTLIVLSALSHDHVPNKKPIIPYLQHKTEGITSIDTLVTIAEQMADKNFQGMQLSDLVDRLSIALPPGRTSSSTTLTTEDLAKKLIKNNLFINRGGFYQFTNPSILCHLLSFSNVYKKNTDLIFLLRSPMENQITQLAEIDDDYLLSWLNSNDFIYQRNIPIVLDHLINRQNKNTDLSTVFPRLVNLIVAKEIPLSIKIKIAAIIYYANQAIFSQLLTKLEKHPSPDCRKLCAFFYGFDQNKTHQEYIINCTNDQDFSVRNFGYMALINRFDANSENLLAELLQNGYDKSGQIVAELLAQNYEKGHDMLKKFSENDHPSCRRNVIYGLRLLQEDWADKLLNKINTEDKVWMVRDAAAHALEKKWDPLLYSPRLPCSPAEDPQLLKFAGDHGQGIPVKTYPYELLKDLLQTGSYEKMLIAIQYLIASPNKDTFELIATKSKSDNPVREIACQALIEVGLRG